MSNRGECPDCIDRIEDLEAQLKTVLDREAETHRRHDAKVEAQAAEIEQLRMQLKAAALWTAEPGTTVAEIRAAFGETE